MRKIIIGLILIATFNGCKKENIILKNLTGIWKINEYNRAGAFTKTNFSDGEMTLEFIKYKKAYTATIKGVFRLDYSDVTKVDIVDTFQYQIKKNEIDITFVQNKPTVGITRPNLTPTFLKRRFKIEGYKTDQIKLTRIDSTDLYIKAIK